MGFEVQLTGSNSGTWGDVLNDNVISYLDVNFAGITSLSLSASNVLLTSSQARNQMLRCSGTLTANVVISPDTSVLWNGIRCVENLTTGSFSLTLQNSAGSVVIPQSRRALVFLDTTNGVRIIGIAGVSGGADPIPVGSQTIWYNSAAPTGWSAVALNDYAIQIVSSGSGGATSGSVAYSTLFARTATDGHTLTVSELAPHNHDLRVYLGTNTEVGSNARRYNDGSGSAPGSLTTLVTETNGGGVAHTHPLDMRVQTAKFTLCSKS